MLQINILSLLHTWLRLAIIKKNWGSPSYKWTLEQCLLSAVLSFHTFSMSDP